MRWTAFLLVLLVLVSASPSAVAAPDFLDTFKNILTLDFLSDFDITEEITPLHGFFYLLMFILIFTLYYVLIRKVLPSNAGKIIAVILSIITTIFLPLNVIIAGIVSPFFSNK